MTTLARSVWMRGELGGLAVRCENVLHVQSHLAEVSLMQFVKCKNLHALTTSMLPVSWVEEITFISS